MLHPLDQAVAALQAGDTTTAQALLTRLLKQDVRNEPAWLLLAQCVDSDDQRRTCLQRVLSLNPGNPLARQLLAALEGDEFQPRPFEDDTRADSVAGASIFESALTRAAAFESPAPAPDFTPEPFTLGGADTPLPEWVHPLTQPTAPEPADPAEALAPDFYVSAPAPAPTAAPADPSASPLPLPVAAPPDIPAPLHPVPLAAPPAPPGLKLAPALRSRTAWRGRSFLLPLGLFLIAAGLIGLILPSLNLQGPLLQTLGRFTGVPFSLIAAGCVVAGIVLLLAARQPKA